MSKKCIFICIFHQEKYIDIFYLLLESLYIFGNIDDITDILIYTNTNFMNIIKDSHLYSENIKFEINDTYDNLDKACKSRLDIFNFSCITNYDKIIYLDTDIIIKEDINKLFHLVKEDILYVLEQGSINDNNDYFGKILFTDIDIEQIVDKSAFSSGILLFNNCEKIKELFNKIKEDIVKRPHNFSCYDQPYIVYNAFKYNLFNNKVLKDYAINIEYNGYLDNINDGKTLIHFAGGPGGYNHKIELMTNYFNTVKDYIIKKNIETTKEYINQFLLPIINDCGELLEGNIFMLHNTTDYTDLYLNKTKNISNLVLNKNIKSIMEIGFNSGFSTLLMLFSNPNIKIKCFDLGEHKYTLPCYEKIKETFGERINLIIGDSTKTLQNINETFDLIHIDGGHSTEVAESDIINSYRLSEKGTILIMDDYDFGHLHNLWNEYIEKYDLKKLNIFCYDTPHHDIKYVKTK